MDQVNRHIELEASNIDAVHRKFSEAYRYYIDRVEARKAQSYIESYKSEAYKIKARDGIAKGEVLKVKMNFNSTKDKAALFVEEMGLQPKFFTDKGAPSFSAELLWQYGEAGMMLASLGTLRISKAQIENLKVLAEYDGRWHIDINVVGAKTGRLSGGYNDG
jgi:DNA polymerase I-like protein with 3'-5' exonuclease and polymerase domains